MTVADLITKLSVYPTDSRVTLLDPQRQWLLPIQVTRLSAVTDSKRVIDSSPSLRKVRAMKLRVWLQRSSLAACLTNPGRRLIEQDHRLCEDELSMNGNRSVDINADGHESLFLHGNASLSIEV
jgi:hypothetical protein